MPLALAPLALVLVGVPASAGETLKCDTVEVVDTDGRPVAHARVNWSDTELPPGFKQIARLGVLWSGVTDDRGRIVEDGLPIVRGGFEVEAPVPLGGRCAGLTEGWWSGRSRRCPVRIVLKVRPLAHSDVRVRVLGPDGRGVAGAYVRLLDASSRSAAGKTCSVPLEMEATTGADGAFVLPSLPHGKATVLVKHPRYAEREVELVVPGPSPDVTLDAGATWTGRVLRPDGSTLDHCVIWLALDHPSASRHAACSSKGFILDRIPAGPAKLRVEMRGVDDPQVGRRVLEQDVRIQPGERRVTDVRWPPGGTIAGRVVTPEGVPVAGVEILAFPATGLPTRDGSDAGVGEISDGEGRFVLRNLTHPGTWALFIDRIDYHEWKVMASLGMTDVVMTAVPRSIRRARPETRPPPDGGPETGETP
jgi:hypothetical protein